MAPVVNAQKRIAACRDPWKLRFAFALRRFDGDGLGAFALAIALPGQLAHGDDLAPQLAQAEQEKLKAEIKAALAERNVNYLEVGCHKVRLSDFSSTRLDSKAIKAVAPALFTQYSKVVTGQRLTIN